MLRSRKAENASRRSASGPLRGETTNVLLLGVGKIGVAITELLHGTSDFRVVVADCDGEALGRIHQQDVTREVVDVGDEAALAQAMAGMDVAISALPYYLNGAVARATGSSAGKANRSSFPTVSRSSRALPRFRCG